MFLIPRSSGSGGGGGGGRLLVSINFDLLKKISHPWVCHERPSQRALMVAYMQFEEAS